MLRSRISAPTLRSWWTGLCKPPTRHGNFRSMRSPIFRSSCSLFFIPRLGFTFTLRASIAWISVTTRLRCTSFSLLLVTYSSFLSYLLFWSLCIVDGSAKVAVLGFFIQVASNESTPLLETIFAHLSSIQTPGTTVQVPTIDFSTFQASANQMAYLCVYS
jgi:hypothetical protein